MAPKMLPTAEYVRECLLYDPDTGEFTWQARPREHFPRDAIWQMWNAQNAGKPAGHVSPAGYLVISKRYFRAHRLAWLLVHGEPVPDVIDHIDRNKLNNRIGNLRASTDADNQTNCKIDSRNRTGIRGVSLSHGGFRAIICRHGRKFELGVFQTLTEAAAARQEAESRLL